MWLWILVGLGAAVLLLVVHDVVQRKHAIIHNFPIIGHLRYILETFGPELRQYIVSDNDEERPFSRDQRTWVYASSKKENNYFGFGTDNRFELTPNYIIVKNSAFPRSGTGVGPNYGIPCAKVLGAARNRKKAFRPQSIINISAMSWGSLSATAVEAINRGCEIAGCLQNTGEGGVSRYHQRGGELIWQIGTGYFGCRDSQGNFDKAKFLEVVASNPIRAIEVKVSQGAKPGLGGMLPGAKVTAEVAKVRGIPIGKDCASPAAHTAFDSVDGLLDFVEMLAEESGLPVGIKSAVGQMSFWTELASLMERGDRGVDYIQVDGGEGGTGAAPLVFSDHVAVPFRIGMSRVYRTFAERNLTDKVVFVGSGKLGFSAEALVAMALGCDMVSVAREAMLAIGCIQAQRCHTGHCPAGVATQSRWLMRGLDPTLKSARLANYVVALRKEILALTHACGLEHPAFISGEHIEFLQNGVRARPLHEVFDYVPGWTSMPPERALAVEELMRG